ncbi:hypothetical protein CKO42_20075 [Lamprobacter modestohalophilus]|uniref:Uncharacterized protein n=1 Tax=Lamprobacter modestohalophilus TaxID=1064514 RepID=A0A9X1B5M7_9GAMM|nr:hypothetical protein [Lamprobacter modestohalophilus]
MVDADITEIEEAVRRLPVSEQVRLIEVIARSLREHERRSTRDKTALGHFLDEMSSLPNASPCNDFSNRDHDRALYGERP